MNPTYKINVVKNKSITYLLPYFLTYFDFDVSTGLLNTYAFFDKNDEFCLLYKWASNPDFLKFEGKVMKHPLFEGHVDYGNRVAYKFKLPLPLQKARELFIKGEYVEFSEDHKNAINNYMKKKGFKNGARIKQILSKNEELSSTQPEIGKETLSNNVKELVIQGGPDSF